MKFIKNPLFMFILGAIIFSSIAVFASATITAHQVTYNNTPVDEVLDDLYSKANKCISGSVHHNPNSQLSINLGFTPTKFLGSYYWNQDNMVLYLNYDSSVSNNFYLSYFESGVAVIADYNDKASFENNYFISNFAGRSYEYDYTFYYMACK